MLGGRCLKYSLAFTWRQIRKFVSSEEFHSAYEQAEVTRKVIDGLLRYLRTKRTQLTKRATGPN